MKKNILTFLFLLFGFLNIYSQQLSKDTFGNTVRKDNYGNILSIYSKDTFGNIVEKDQYGNTVATYSVDTFGNTVKTDQYGNIVSTFSKDTFGNTVETDQNGNVIATYSKDTFGKTIKTDNYGNQIATNSYTGNGFNYDNSRPPLKFNDYIDPIDNKLLMKTLQTLDNNYNNRKPISQYDRKRYYVNEMLYKYDNKLLEQSLKTKKKEEATSKINYKQLQKKQANGDLVDIITLKDGWYQVLSQSEDFYAERYVEVVNHNVINWVNGQHLKFPTSNLNRPSNISSPYSLYLNLPDGKTQNINFYFVNSKSVKTPISYEPAVFIIYTKDFIDGEMLYTRIYGNDINQLQGTELSWTANSNPKCNDDKRVIKFYLPKGETFKFHSNTKTSYWEGEIVMDSYCKSLNLKVN